MKTKSVLWLARLGTKASGVNAETLCCAPAPKIAPAFHDPDDAMRSLAESLTDCPRFGTAARAGGDATRIGQVHEQ